LNYAWEVCGAARWTHWQGEPGDIGTPAHPTRRVFSSPAVYEFNSTLPVSYAPWYEPSWWYAGARPHLIASVEVRNFARYSAWLLVLFLATPGMGLALAIAAWKRKRQRVRLSSPVVVTLVVPALAFMFLYALVYVDRRYVAGQLDILGLAVCAAAMPLFDTPRLRRAIAGTAVATALAFTGLFLGGSIGIGLHDLLTWNTSDFTRHHEHDRALELRTLGLKPGDRVGYIGFSFGAYWALLDGVRIVSDVPVKFPRRGGLANLEVDDYSEIDEFWRAPAATQQRVLDLMKKAGASAVVADIVPSWARTDGWHHLNAKLNAPSGRNDTYVRFLE
jgi:hypothetical protein